MVGRGGGASKSRAGFPYLSLLVSKYFLPQWFLPLYAIFLFKIICKYWEFFLCFSWFLAVTLDILASHMLPCPILHSPELKSPRALPLTLCDKNMLVTLRPEAKRQKQNVTKIKAGRIGDNWDHSVMSLSKDVIVCAEMNSSMTSRHYLTSYFKTLDCVPVTELIIIWSRFELSWCAVLLC